MKNIFKVFRLLIDNKTDLFKTKFNMKKTLKSVLLLILNIVAITFLIIFFVKKITSIGIRVNNNLLSIILLVTHILAIVFALGNIIKNLYLSKDNELLMGLPTTHNQIFFAKIFSVYFSDFLANLKYFLPVFITIGYLGKFTYIYYLTLPLFLFTLPILAVALAGLISIPAMLIFNLIKKKLPLLVGLIMSFSAGFIFVYVRFVSSIVNVINIGQKQIQTVINTNNWISKFASFNKPYLIIADAMMGKNLLVVFPILLVISIVAFFLASLLVRPFYFKMASKQGETTTKEKKKKTKYKVSSPMMSLLKKETLTVFRSPGYLFQYFLFTLLMPFIVYVYDKLLLSLTISMSGEIMIIGSHIMILSIMVMLSTTISASAISREGANYYLMKVSPIEYKKQTLAKVLFNGIIIFIAILATTILGIIFINIDPLYIILSSLVVFIASIGHICYSYDLDLRNPTLNWYDSSEIDELSKNTSNSMIIGLLISFLMGLFMFLLPSSFFSWATLIVFAIVYCIGRIYLLNVRIDYYFEKNEI